MMAEKEFIEYFKFDISHMSGDTLIQPGLKFIRKTLCSQFKS